MRSDTNSTLFVGRVQGGGNIAMADFAFRTEASVGDSGCARFVARNRFGATIRAVEAQASRDSTTPAAAQTFGIEVGVHTRLGNPTPASDVRTIGVYIATNPYGWVNNPPLDPPPDPNNPPPQPFVDCGVFIEARGPSGWHYAMRYRDSKDGQDRFSVDNVGNVHSNGSVSAVGNVVAANVNANGSGSVPGEVRATGAMFATAFNTTSSRAAKENISHLEADEAGRLLGALTPAHYTLKSQPDVKRLGFIADDVPHPLSPDGSTVSLMEVIATLTRVAQDQRATMREQQEAIDRLRRDLDRCLARSTDEAPT